MDCPFSAQLVGNLVVCSPDYFVDQGEGWGSKGQQGKDARLVVDKLTPTGLHLLSKN